MLYEVITRLEKLSNKQVKQLLKDVYTPGLGSNLADKVRSKKLNFNPDLDVRGHRAEEAIIIVTNHIDDAIMCEVNNVRILHGKGNGILRQMIREILNTMPHVKSFKDA